MSGKTNEGSRGHDGTALCRLGRCSGHRRIGSGLRGKSDIRRGCAENTPVEIIDKLNKEINAVLADPASKARLADLGVTPLGGTAADFKKSLPTKPRSGQGRQVLGPKWTEPEYPIHVR
jgi:hypothetical protein